MSDKPESAARWSVSVSHIDTCLSCYLQDHHNRDGELLLGVPVDGTTTNKAVMDALESEFASGGDDGFPEELDESDVARAIGSYFAGADLDSPFDSSLEVPDEDEEPDGEGPQAWFLVEWTRDDDEESDA